MTLQYRKGETKVCFHLDAEPTPYLVKLSIPLGEITLRDFKRALPRTNFKYFFKSTDPEFGVVKEQIVDDATILPTFDNRVVGWLVTSESRRRNEPVQISTCSHVYEEIEIRQSSLDSGGQSTELESDTATEHASGSSSRRTPRNLLTATTIDNSGYENLVDGILMPSEATSIATQRTGSAGCLNKNTRELFLVELTLSTPSLGIHIIRSAEGAFFIDSIVEGSVVFLDRRISIGDELLGINDVSMHNLSESEAVNVIRGVLALTNEVKLFLARREIYQNPSDYERIGRIQPIDTQAWILHTEAALRDEMLLNDFLQIPFAAKSEIGSLVEAGSQSAEDNDENDEREFVTQLVRMMATPGSGLKIKDRKWLSFRLKNATVGADVVEWIQLHVTGPSKRREAKIFAEKIFEVGLLRHPVVREKFSEKSTYTFCDEIDQLYDEHLCNKVHSQSELLGVQLQETASETEATTDSALGKSGNFLAKSWESISSSVLKLLRDGSGD